MGKHYYAESLLDNTVDVDTSETNLFGTKDFKANELEELLIQVTDDAANAATLKLYGSADGTDYCQLYFYRLSDNIYDGTAAANTQTTVVGATKVCHIWTRYCLPWMRLTAERSTGSGNITINVYGARPK